MVLMVYSNNIRVIRVIRVIKAIPCVPHVDGPVLIISHLNLHREFDNQTPKYRDKIYEE